MMLDISGTFKSVDHATLLQSLNTSYNFDGTVIHWFTSYLSGCTQRVCSAGSTFPSLSLSCRIPQGSVLDPILFLLYTADLLSIVKRHQLIPHAYADDVQIYGLCASLEVGTLQERITPYISMFWRVVSMDSVQPITTKPVKNRTPLVCLKSTTNPNSGRPGESR